jgi:hypothetical protein
LNKETIIKRISIKFPNRSKPNPKKRRLRKHNNPKARKANNLVTKRRKKIIKPTKKRSNLQKTMPGPTRRKASPPKIARTNKTKRIRQFQPSKNIPYNNPST